MRGKPVLGAISGLLFGVFVALFLQQWAIYPLTPLSVIGLPVLGFILGLLLAAWAPFGRSKQGDAAGSAPVSEAPEPSAAEPETDQPPA